MRKYTVGRMGQYHHEGNLHNKRRYIRRSRRAFILVVGGLVIILGLIIADIIRNLLRDKPSQPTNQTTATYVPYNQTFETPYYQFLTGRNWQFVQARSTPTQFYYRYMNGEIIEHEMTITINGDPSPAVSRVLPVNRENNGRLNPHQVSDLCHKYLPAGAQKITQPVTISSVRITCDYDRLDYSVIIGVVGESLPLTMTRRDGSRVAITILYHNLKGQTDDVEVRRIVESFEAR